MQPPRVLIGYSACQLTARAFLNAGCEAWTCDFLPARGEVAFAHHVGDVWPLLRDPRGWDLAVVHPMCTYLTVSAAWAYKDPDVKRYPKTAGYRMRVKPGTLTGAARRAARDEAIKNFCALMALPFPVIAENPAPSFLNKALCPPYQIIHPYDFGHDASKSTGLWFNRAATDAGMLPLFPTKCVEPRQVCKECKTAWHGYPVGCPRCGCRNTWERWGNQTDSGQNRLSPSDTRWLERSETYPGIAAAMGAQWGEWLCST